MRWGSMYTDLIWTHPGDPYGVYDKEGNRYFCNSDYLFRSIIAMLILNETRKAR
jgi:beta-xylosidase